MATRDYERAEITVHWDSSLCIHTAICLQALPEVFNAAKRPWVDIEGASAEAIAAAVARCPTGALTFSSAWLDETLPNTTTMRPVKGGPMIVRGDARIVDRDGNTISRSPRMALCRCGRSGNQPFCDNSHRTSGFDEPEPRGTRSAESPDEICPPQPDFD